MELRVIMPRLLFVTVVTTFLILFVTKEAKSRLDHVEGENQVINANQDQGQGNPLSFLSKIKAYFNKAEDTPARTKRSKRSANDTDFKMNRTEEKNDKSTIKVTSTNTEIDLNCYTKIEFMVLMGFVILVILCFLTLFIFIVLIQDRFCITKKKRRSPIHHQSTESFAPCKWWMSKDEDAKNLSDLFHDRVSKLRNENYTASNGDIKEYMQRLIPECEQDRKLRYTAPKLYSINDKKLLISVSKGDSGLTYQTDGTY